MAVGGGLIHTSAGISAPRRSVDKAFGMSCAGVIDDSLPRRLELLGAPVMYRLRRSAAPVRYDDAGCCRRCPLGDVLSRHNLIGQVTVSRNHVGPAGLRRRAPFFFERFGPAYKAEVAHYIDQCRAGERFAVDHRDGLKVLEIATVGSGGLQGREGGIAV